ncbi:MAG: hypothetical protein ACK5AN_10975 [Planctomyces sp.]
MTANESVCGATLWPVGSSVGSRRTGGRTGSEQRSLSFNRPARMWPIRLTRMSSSPIVYHQTSLYRLVTERRTLNMTSRIQKRLLLPKRVRHPPREGFSWVDRRFLKDYAARLSRDAILLYFFFSAASDQHGLSFYSDATIALRLKLTEKAICDARAELVTLDLIAWQRPLTQVLSLQQPGLIRNGGLQSIADLLRSTGNASEQKRNGGDV